MTTTKKSRHALALIAALAAAMAWDARARADEPRSDPTAEEKEVARKHFEVGLRELQAKNPTAARHPLMRAWQITGHPQVAGHLGACELELGNHADAARFLWIALEEPRDKTPKEQRARLEELFGVALSKVGRVEIGADVEGAEVKIDGKPVGRTPVSRPIFVAPGTVALRIESAGRPPLDRTIQVAPGAIERVSFQLEPARAATPAADRDRAAAAPTGGERSTLPVWIGAGTATLGIGLGVVFMVVSQSNASDAGAARSELYAQSGNSETFCTQPPPDRAVACADMIADSDAAARFKTASVLSFVGGGIGLGAGLAWYLLQPSASSSATGVQAVPVVTAGGAAIQVRATW